MLDKMKLAKEGIHLETGETKPNTVIDIYIKGDVVRVNGLGTQDTVEKSDWNCVEQQLAELGFVKTREDGYRDDGSYYEKTVTAFAEAISESKSVLEGLERNSLKKFLKAISF